MTYAAGEIEMFGERSETEEAEARFREPWGTVGWSSSRRVARVARVAREDDRGRAAEGDASSEGPPEST